jgi:hypothetical protein
MYSVGVRIDGIVSRRRSAGVLHVIIGLYLIIEAAAFYRYQAYRNFAAVIPVLMIGSFSLFYGFFRRRIDLTYRYNYWLRLLQVLTFTVLGILMTGVGQPMDSISLFVFAFLCIILLFSERKIFQETNILFDEQGILIPGDYRDHLVKWDAIEDVVVREDFLTIFHKKEKYLQYQVMQDLSTLELAKMNAFCREQINRCRSEAGDLQQEDEITSAGDNTHS